MTDAEKRLWAALRGRQMDGFTFRRQAEIGPYIVDFVCYERKLVLEADGGQHALNRNEDASRTAWLESQGFVVVRFWNHQILEELDAILEVIWQALKAGVADETGVPRTE